MNNESMKLCTYMGFLAGMFTFIGLWPIAHIIPPLAPGMSHAEVADFYRQHQIGILGGSIFVMTAATLFFPFMAALAVFMKKIEGAISPLTYAFLMLSVVGFLTLFLAAVFFTAAAYRPDYPDEIIHALSDVAYFILVIPAVPAFALNVLSGAAILGDRRQAPILPRWLGYLSLWSGLLMAPGLAIGLFKIGPFAWNGVLAFWVVAVGFGIWFNGMVFGMLSALKNNRLASE